MSLRLLQLARGSRTGGDPRPEGAAPPESEPCDLCAEPLPDEHRHLVDLRERRLMCVCRACALLFDRPAASDGHYRPVGERRLPLEGFRLDDATWEELRIPVDMAFFVRDGATGRVTALYPGPMGATESLLELEAWEGIEAANPILREMEPDVEALLVNRARGAREHWLVPVDVCYRLVAVMRTRWRGLAGGREVWEEVARFFEELGRRASAAPSGAAHGEEDG